MMLGKIKYCIMVVLFFFFKIFPIKQNKVVFVNFRGKGYGGNCKYIAEELLKTSQNSVDLVWICREGHESVPKGIRVVQYNSIKSVYELCTAKVWVDNCRKPGFVRKKKKQYYIMTWHGSIGLKKVEKDAEKVLGQSYAAAAKRDSKMADLFLAASALDENLYRQSFWYSGEIMRCGLPREDILFGDSATLKKKIKEAIGIPEDKKIVMYAPTFRVGEQADSISLFEMDWSRVLNALKTGFGGDWYGIIRLHPNISKYGSMLTNHPNVFNATAYPDMQELLLIADCIITDYSSSITEFSRTGNPGFIFAKDIEEYAKDRDFYFPFQELPFPIATTDNELIDNIVSFDLKKYQEKNRAFYYDKCGVYDGGHASEQVARKILDVIEST